MYSPSVGTLPGGRFSYKNESVTTNNAWKLPSADKCSYLCGMKEDFYINGKPAYETFGVRFGSGCIDALESPLELKDALENEDRRENGSRLIVRNTFKKRTVTLKFRIHGGTDTEYLANKKAFEAELYKGIHKLQINGREEYYHLVYTGKSVSYSHSYNGKFGELSMQFVEPNPANRAETANENVVSV